MSKVKHLLRKLHIGDHQNHGRPPPVDPSAQTTPSQEPTSTSPSFDLPPTTSSSENENTNDGSFSYFEEEFQVQLALAISVSDQGRSGVDSENAQIDVAKQISLGRSPTQNLDEFMSLRYWSCNVLSYDEKVIDGFYDICGTATNLVSQSKMPSLIELEAVSTLDDKGYEVVLVNRAVDLELRHLEERVYFMSLERNSLDKTLNACLLVKKIADLIVERMGGPVVDVEDMFSRWTERKNELRIQLNTIVLPLGSLDIGHSRQRALLFKVLADRIKLPCKLVKGSYYTGTDEGAVNLIKLDDGSEYIIDLMGAPGTLIPSEVPSSPHRNFELEGRSTSAVVESDLIPCTASGLGSRIISSLPIVDDTPKIGFSVLTPSAVAIESNGEGRRIAVKKQTPHPDHDYEVSLNTGKRNSTAWGSLVDDSCYDSSSVNELEYARELGTLRTGKCVTPSNISDNLGMDEVLEMKGLVGRESVFDEGHQPQNEQSLVPLTGLHLLNNACNSSREPSDEAFGTNLFKIDYEGHESSLNVPGERRVPVKAPDELISLGHNAACREEDFSGNAEGILVLPFDQSGAKKIQDVQPEHVINGVDEILWEDLQIGERIGIGSYGEVYRSEWNGTEVAVKKFMNQDITGDALAQFKSEVEIMLRLRHPNVVLFMGAVTCPPNMSILTEYLPRGSLYKLLHRPNIQIDERRRIKMALDVAKGMNYLHTSHPTIVHRDLKTPNLLVDKNWVVKVCDFGMSRLQHHTFLSSKSTAGTAEWMAPEVLRNEQSNEKCDVYSFGVILWELATLQVPWAGLNSMQVVGAVGFQSRHLDILPTIDPMAAEIISDCWNRNPHARPSFAEIIARLKRLQRLSVHKIVNCKDQL